MLYKTRGIVFRVTEYSETSVVAQIFTEEFGLQSYLINGVKKAKAKIKLNMIQPLHLLEMVVYHKPQGGIQRISELRNAILFQSIPYHIVKSSIAFFLNEVLCKAVRHHYDDKALFNFLFNAIELLDRIEQNMTDFHLVFLVQLTRYLGFYPDRTLEGNARYFDLVNGQFADSLPSHALIIHGADLRCFSALLKCRFDSLSDLLISSGERRALIGYLLNYYELHLEGFNSVKSHEILEEVLH